MILSRTLRKVLRQYKSISEIPSHLYLDSVRRFIPRALFVCAEFFCRIRNQPGGFGLKLSPKLCIIISAVSARAKSGEALRRARND